MPSKRANIKRSKEKEQKQQHVRVAEFILMTSFTLVKRYMLQKVFEISTRSSHTGFSIEFLKFKKIPGMSHISPAATKMQATTSSTESTGVSYTSVFICPQQKKS
ncbi:hypothetical protein AVEN_97751-1 [Araneus ventricosus]|uniref:Uncharacterized protein n=1 Tax=Araneus ventricosus TaxID=182803 RepID=A0A4Y2E2H8_ARAVE|nr:hypothetical protein AVEN_97751-1 [Araneus ventricosus]